LKSAIFQMRKWPVG